MQRSFDDVKVGVVDAAYSSGIDHGDIEEHTIAAVIKQQWWQSDFIFGQQCCIQIFIIYRFPNRLTTFIQLHVRNKKRSIGHENATLTAC